jgi:hypothetical protein
MGIQYKYLLIGRHMTLPVLSEKVVNPGEQSLLYDLSRVSNKKQPKVLASASRIYDVKIMQNNFSFKAKAPQIH